MSEWWTQGISHPAAVARQAARAEEAGWDGFAMVDSQNLAGDVYVGMTLAAAATERIQLGTAVTNPVTRHPAATAAAIASVQEASGGRAVLGIGRGDSSLAHIGRAPASVATFERYLDLLQRYLRGETIAFDDLPAPEGTTPVGELPIAELPAGSSLHWLRGPKVPVEVAATGPRVLECSARLADRVLLAVGADPARLAWAADVCRQANPDVSLGAFVNVGVHPDVAVARDLVRGGLSTFARFSVMHGKISGPADEVERDTLGAIGGRYDMTRHTQVGSAQAKGLPDDFVDRFAVVGPPDAVTERLASLSDLGIDKVMVVGATQGADPDVARESTRLFLSEVLPALRTPAR